MRAAFAPSSVGCSPLSWACFRERYPARYQDALPPQKPAEQDLTHTSAALTGSDPRLPPSIDPCFLSDPADVPPLVAGFELARSILRAPAFASAHATEIVAGARVQTADDVRRYIHESAFTVFHPDGTCHMGRDSDSVVDPQLHVPPPPIDLPAPTATDLRTATTTAPPPYPTLENQP